MSDQSSAPNAPHRTIAGTLWSSSSSAANAARAVVLVALGAALLTLSAKINLPLPYVPMTLQTLVVLMIGAVYGWRLGTATIVVYLAVGALGLPVFAGPVGGLKPLLGPTAGFLYGFVVAGFLTGWLSERGWDRSMLWLFVAMAIGHVVIMAMGFGWLAFGMKLGVAKAWSAGVVPFLAGAFVKNTLGAILVPFLRGVVDRRYR
jgi:biotin transport system substrate-specific component